MNLVWPGGTIVFLVPVFHSSCFVQVYASMGLVLGEPCQLIFGDFVRSMMSVPGVSPSRGCLWIHVDS